MRAAADGGEQEVTVVASPFLFRAPGHVGLIGLPCSRISAVRVLYVMQARPEGAGDGAAHHAVHPHRGLQAQAAEHLPHAGLRHAGQQQAEEEGSRAISMGSRRLVYSTMASLRLVWPRAYDSHRFCW